MSRPRSFLLLAGCTMLVAPLTAQTATAPTAPLSNTAKLKLVVILSRHGVRSPTWTQARLDAYSTLPWPQWSVPPGNLTTRGYELIRQFGNFDRSKLATAGLLSSHGCEDGSKTYIWADTDQRTLASGKALAEGLFPACPPVVHSLAPGENDPLFHPTANGVKPAEADAAFAELSERTKQPLDSQQHELLDEMQHVLLGCDPNIACIPAQPPKTPLTGTPTAANRGKGDHIVDLEGPLAQASSFSEDFLLEYADGLPMQQVGWGKVDEPQLRKFLALHSDYFDLMHRTSSLARLEASNMLSHISRTLEQAVTQKPVDGAFATPDTKLVLLAGHDTNLAGVAALLGLHWALDGRTDDTPPGTELAFEVWQNTQGAYTVRVTVAMQTLQQLREMKQLTHDAPPAHEDLTIPGCHTEAPACDWGTFQHIADSAIDVPALAPGPHR